MGPKQLKQNQALPPFKMGKAHLVKGKYRTKGQSMVNMVSLNLIVLKEHILKQDSFGYRYLVSIVDMTLEELISCRNGAALAVPMELMEIFNLADEKLKGHRKSANSARHYTRLYVKLWSRLHHYISQVFDYQVAERILVEAYNSLSIQKYHHILKIV